MQTGGWPRWATTGSSLFSFFPPFFRQHPPWQLILYSASLLYGRWYKNECVSCFPEYRLCSWQFCSWCTLRSDEVKNVKTQRKVICVFTCFQFVVFDWKQQKVNRKRQWKNTFFNWKNEKRRQLKPAVFFYLTISCITLIEENVPF